MRKIHIKSEEVLKVIAQYLDECDLSGHVIEYDDNPEYDDNTKYNYVSIVLDGLKKPKGESK